MAAASTIQSTAAIDSRSLGDPEIGVDEFDSAFPERLDVQLAAGTAEIIKPDDFERRIVVEQTVRDTAPDETADAGE